LPPSSSLPFSRKASEPVGHCLPLFNGHFGGKRGVGGVYSLLPVETTVIPSSQAPPPVQRESLVFFVERKRAHSFPKFFSWVRVLSNQTNPRLEIRPLGWGSCLLIFPTLNFRLILFSIRSSRIETTPSLVVISKIEA